MAHELKIFDDYVPQSKWPHISCPTCPRGAVVPEVLQSAPSGNSLKLRKHEAWEPDWETGTFYDLLKCESSSCGETISIAGDYKIDYLMDEEGHWYGDYEDYFLLRFANPPLPILNTPPEAPEVVKEAIAKASQILWVDPSAAANRLRFAIEMLLTSVGARRFVTKNGKRSRLTTHARILEFKLKNPSAGEALEAVKWIGNSGSHEDSLTIADVLDSAEMLGHALRIIFNKEEQAMLKRIQSVNKAKGVPKKRLQPGRSRHSALEQD